MSLAEIWTRSPDQLADKQVHQIIAFAGAGQLTDGGAASEEFREFLRLVPGELLSRYATECLTSSFQGSGFALQDIINQIGRRLGYDVIDGRYRGISSEVGNDGLWHFPDGHAVVVEVKTTDVYTIDLQRIADYRRRIIGTGALTEDDSSILIVVGREETPGLEAQIRGSKHAWDVRLISVDALLRLMALRQRLDDPATVRRICDILKPREYTRVDEIVDLVFSAAEESSEEEVELVPDAEQSVVGREAPVAFHGACVARVEDHYARPLVRRTRSGYTTGDGKFGIICVVSKTHDVLGHPSFWFAFHPYQREFLKDLEEAYLVLGCGSPHTIFAIPRSQIENWLSDLWTTERDGRMYWHVRIHAEDGQYKLDRRGGLGRVNVTQYLLPTSA